MKFKLMVQQCSPHFTPMLKAPFELRLVNETTRQGIILVTGNNIDELKLRGSDLFDNVNWRATILADFEISESFTLQ